MATIKALIPLSGGRNKLSDPRLDTLNLHPRGATVVDTHPTSGAPDGGRYFRRTMTTANTSSPMNATLNGSGTAGAPVTPGSPITPSIWARKTAGGPALRFDINWYTAAGAFVSSSAGTGNSIGSAWQRVQQAFTPPATAAFGQLAISWSGTALVAQTLDLAMVQLEYGSSASPWTDNQTVNPLLVLNYGFSRESRNVVLDLMGSEYPAVFLRKAQSRSGTLTMLFGSATAANDADGIFQSVNRFHFQEPAGAQDFHFVRSGPVEVVKTEGVNSWTVAVGFREVAPL